jgi:hypothetical protein
MWLNFKPQAVLWRSRCRELEIWSQGLALISWNFDLFFLVFVIELQTSSCFMKVSFLRAWNVTPRLGSNDLKFKVIFSIMWLNFKPQALLWRSHCRELEMWAQGLAQMSWNVDLFYYSFWLNFKPQGVLWRSRCRELEIWPQRLSQMSWDFDFSDSFWLNFKAQVVLWRFRRRDLEMWAQAWLKWAKMLIYFFIHFDWTSILKVFYGGLVAESLKSDLKGWLKWTKILIFLILCGGTSKLKLFSEGLVAESLKCEPKAWLKWAEILILFFHSLWLNLKPQAVYQGLDAESLKFEPKAWLTWAEILNIFSFFVIELQILSCFMKVSLPRAWNLTSKVGSNELRIWFFLFFVVVLQSSSCFMKVSLLRPWNLSPQLGSNELKFWFMFFSLLDWTSNLELFYEGLVAKSLKCDPSAWPKWAEI